MALSEEDIRKRITEGKKRKAIQAAEHYEARLRFHVCTRTEAVPDGSGAVADFFAFVRKLLPEDKFNTFKALFRFPVKTNEICDIIFNKLERVFDGQNPSFDYQFAKPEYKDDWEWYRSEVLHEPQVWHEKGWNAFKVAINSVLVCDMPREGKGGKPEPYFYWLPVGALLDYRMTDNGGMEYIAFRQPDGIAVIDDYSYRLFAEKDGTIGALVGEEIPHGLEYCPARFFWDAPLNPDTPDIKDHPLARVLDSLDWYLFFHTAKKQLDIFGSYPIYSGYEEDCDYTSKLGEHCDHGFLKDKDGYYVEDANGIPVRCPRCKNKRIVGPGTFIEIPQPSEALGVPDMRSPVQMLSIDRSSLDYNVSEDERLRKEIIESVTGVQSPDMTMQSYNELQVQSSFESQTSVLRHLKKGFESAQKFVDETICRLRYGTDEFLSAQVDYGTEFFLLSPSELRRRYKEAKDNGASLSELDTLAQRVAESEWRTTPAQLQRMKMLADIEPLRHYSTPEALELHAKGIASLREITLKTHFSDLLRRFERENANILEFGAAVDYKKRIEIITKTLYDYANEIIGENV